MSNRGIQSYPVPAFLAEQGVTQGVYGKWLDEKAKGVAYRDRRRLGPIALGTVRAAIHQAVHNGGDRDFYTGEPLNWQLLQRLNGNGTQADKADHHLVPSVDHHTLSATEPVFRICSLLTNKCKSDYSLNELEDFCRKFLAHQKLLREGTTQQ